MEFKIPVPWGHIAGRSYGSWSGTPVLGIHTWKDNCASFEVIGPLIPKEIYFVVIDLPGHGQSSHYPPGIAYHRVDFATIIKRVADHQRWKKFTLLGHGVGAEIALLFTAAFSHMVNRLVLIDTIKPSSYSFVNGAKELAAAIDEQLTFDLKYQQNNDHPPHFDYDEEIKAQIKRTNGELSEVTAKFLVDRSTIENGNEMKNCTDIRLSCPDTLRFSHDQVMNLLEKVKGLSVLFIKTKDTPLQDQDGLAKFAIEKLRRICSKFLDLEINGGHYSHMARPENFVQTLEDFLLEQ